MPQGPFERAGFSETGLERFGRGFAQPLSRLFLRATLLSKAFARWTFWPLICPFNNMPHLEKEHKPMTLKRIDLLKNNYDNAVSIRFFAT